MKQEAGLVSFRSLKSYGIIMLYRNQLLRAGFDISQTRICCEQYSEDSYQIYQDNQLTQLPLPPELSSQIFAKMRQWRWTMTNRKSIRNFVNQYRKPLNPETIAELAYRLLYGTMQISGCEFENLD